MKLFRVMAISVILTFSLSCSKDKNDADIAPSWEVISTEQGLLNNQTNCIFKASDNTIWVGSTNGVSHFDGTNWTNYTINDGSNNYGVRDIGEDADGNILVATVFYYFGSSAADVYIFNGSSFELFLDDEFPNPNYIFKDSQGRQWFVFFQSGVGYLQNGQLTMLTNEDGLISNSTTCVTEDKVGNILIGTHGGLSIWDGTGFTNYTKENGMQSDRIDDITVDISGNIWLAHYESHGGVTKFDGESFTFYSEEDGAGSYYLSIYATSDGSVWAGTSSDAAYRYKGGTWRVYTDYFDITSTNYVNDIEEIGDDLWFCVYGAGLVVYRNFKNEK